MGTILSAECECGFCRDSIAAGGGMRDFTTVLSAPALCRTCGEFLVLNYLEGEHHCPECGGKVTFYNSRSLQERTGFDSKKGHNVFNWRIGESRRYFRLPDVAYLCPQCNEKKMRFFMVGCWD